MPRRHLVSEPRVQEVVDRLVQRLRQVGSVNALAEQVSAASGQRIYPNRIHGLLAEDVSRTVTAATLEALERGLGSMPVTGEVAPAYRDLDARVAAAASALPAGADQVVAIATALDLPPAVVRRSLPGMPSAQATPTEARAGQPDWAWQDTAVTRILDSLRQPADNRVGLIVPTGGGKTRLGLRIILDHLAMDARNDSVALWVTHRRRLRRQARRSLQELVKEGTHVPPDAASLFERIRFVMLGDLAATVEELGDSVSLIVIDEAHHAAAPSYAPIFATACPALFLTATPVRADRLPIGIDRVAYTTTYGELFRRNCVIEPIFDPPLDMPGLDWSTKEGLAELADYLLDRTEQDFGKVLVAVSQQERVERLHRAVVDLLDERSGHPLTAEDVIFVHGGANSLGVADASDALDESAGRPAGILIATSALVGEGYDDPTIDAAVVTYPSNSIAHLMQVAGRALRWAPGKRRAHVVQLRESSLQYYFDQRWLYQEISDELRPDLVDLEYASGDELSGEITKLLDEHNVSPAIRHRIETQLHAAPVGEDVRLMLCGINYYGPLGSFSAAPWTALLVDEPEWSRFLNIFNDLSLRQEDIKEPQQFLQTHVSPDAGPGSLWKSYMDLINAAEYARREIHGHAYPGSTSRPYRAGSNTSWLRYVTLRYRPSIPAALEEFLSDAVNRAAVVAAFTASPSAWTQAVKIRLPLSGSVASLLDEHQATWLGEARADLLERLQAAPLESGFIEVMTWRAALNASPIPMPLLDQVEQLLRAADWDERHLEL